jgi:hypothetical protein
VRSAVAILATFALRAATFEADAVPILRAKCQGCHSRAARSGGLSVESLDDILRGGKSGPAIVPSRPTDSLVMALAAAGKMPMSGPKLSEPELAALRAWIQSETRQPPVAERDVMAILSAKCWVCHGRRERQAGLDLRTRESMSRAIVPGKPDESLLVKRIAAREMPPPKLQEQFSVRGLTDEELAKVRRWIEEGARPDNEQPLEVDAASDPAIKPADRAFWAFRPPRRPETPAYDPPPMLYPAGFRRLVSDIDAMVMAGPPADNSALVRRVYYDLTGLPPPPDLASSYLVDANPMRYERLVDRLLESPHYGERWGRHWLDAVGYVDSEGGNNSDAPRPHAWRYRDYVIRAFNANMPYDRFLTEQIAGDELFDHRARPITPSQLDLMAATGFWRMAPDGTNSTEQNFIPERMDVIAGQIEILGSAVMGLSLGCARCHDHKYDPLPTRDYYRLAAILTPAFDPYHWLPGEFPCGGVGAKCDHTNTRYFVGDPDHPKPIQLVRALFDLGPDPPPTRILHRGDAAAPGALVGPGVPSILAAGLKPYRVEPLAHSSGRRLALARWLTQPDHPLTARVMVNRIWQHHFGEGLVSTPGNFGRMGAPPSHPELLDWLATEFVRSGWDIKALHRTIMRSRAYRQPRIARLDAESLRDTILQVSGRLDTRQFGPADATRQDADGEVVATTNRRSVYIQHRRTRPVSLLETFDQPFHSPNCVRRGQSVVASQSLHLLNGDLARESARHMAGRVIDQTRDDLRSQVERAYLLALSRFPSQQESAEAEVTIRSMSEAWLEQLAKDRPAEPIASRARWLALASLCHTLMNSAEFLYIE